MDEIQHHSPEINSRSVNFKTNINLNAKTQAVQNVNFQEILNKVGGQQSAQGLATQGNSINLDSINSQNLHPEEAGNTSNEKNPLNDKNNTISVKVAAEQDPHTTLFSHFNPQKPANIKESSLNFANQFSSEEKGQFPDEEINNPMLPIETNPVKNDKTKINKLKSGLLKAKDPAKKPLSKNFYDSETYKDSYFKEVKIHDAPSENLARVSKNELQSPLLIPAFNEKNPDDEQKKRKPKNPEFLAETEKTDEEVFIFEVNKIIEGYGLKKPLFGISRTDGNNEDHNLWLKSLIFGASNESLTVNESEVLAKYIVKEEEIPFSDKEILAKLLSEIFKHQVISLNPNLITRLDKASVELIYSAFPSVILNGFLKKTVSEIEKGKNKSVLTLAIYKLVNGLKTSEAEIREITYFFQDEFEEGELNTLNNILAGYYHKDDMGSIKRVISMLAGKDSLPPGFTGSLQEIFLELVNHEQPETARQVLKILEVYAQGNDFSAKEAKITAALLAKKYFSSKLIDNHKVTNIFSQLIMGEKVDYLALELLAKLTGKSLLAYLPARLDPEVNNFLKYMPFTENEVKYQEDIEVETNSLPEFYFSGKIKVSGINKLIRKAKLILTLANCATAKEIEIATDQTFMFKHKIEIGNYRLNYLKITWDNNIININLKDFATHGNDITGFSVDSAIDIFYFGTLKVFLNSDDFSLNKLQLKNDYKSFLEYNKKVLKFSLKDKIIKINSKLFSKI